MLILKVRALQSPDAGTRASLDIGISSAIQWFSEDLVQLIHMRHPNVVPVQNPGAFTFNDARGTVGCFGVKYLLHLHADFLSLYIIVGRRLGEAEGYWSAYSRDGYRTGTVSISSRLLSALCLEYIFKVAKGSQRRT